MTKFADANSETWTVFLFNDEQRLNDAQKAQLKQPEIWYLSTVVEAASSTAPWSWWGSLLLASLLLASLLLTPKDGFDVDGVVAVMGLV